MKALLCLLVLSAADALAAAAEATVAKGKLLVCVQEARGLLDLDAQESVGTQGSDTFVAVFLGGTMIGETSVLRDSAHPVWNECFTAPGGEIYDASTPVSFAVLDADLGTADDVIGTGCTTASSGQRWLELTGPRADDHSDRGRIKVRTFLFAKDVHANPVDALQWQTVSSSYVVPVDGAAAASTYVSCPAGKTMTGCQCASTSLTSSAEPGCASSRIEAATAETGGVERCVATALPYTKPPPLPPCPPPEAAGDGGDAWWLKSSGSRTADEPGKTCAPPGWVPPGPAPIHATARCAVLSAGSTEWGGGMRSRARALSPRALGASGTVHDETSPPSRATYLDATDVTCSRGIMTSCSLSSSAGGLGTRFEDGDGDGKPECVGYSDGDAGPVTAQARCASDEAFVPTTTVQGVAVGGDAGMRAYALPLIARTAIGGTGLWTAAACPPPFRLAGCACYSENQNCRGVAFSHAAPPPASAASAAGGVAAVGGGAAAGSIDVCNVSQIVPDAWWRMGAEAHAMCIWSGRPEQLIGLGAEPAACPEHAGPSEMSDKSWLPPDWREKMRVRSAPSSSSARRSPAWGGRGSGSTGGFGPGFFAGVLAVTMVLTGAVLLRSVLTNRRRRQLGGAPTMHVAQRVTIHPTGTPTGTCVAGGGLTSTTMAAPIPPSGGGGGGGGAGGGSYTAPTLPIASAIPISTPLITSDAAAAVHAEAAAGSRV